MGISLIEADYTPLNSAISKVSVWWAHQDSNLGPTGYEPVALTN